MSPVSWTPALQSYVTQRSLISVRSGSLVCLMCFVECSCWFAVLNSYAILPHFFAIFREWLINSYVAVVIFWDTSKMVLSSWLIFFSMGMVPVKNHNLLLKGCILHFPVWFQRPISFCLQVGISHRNLGLDQSLFFVFPYSSLASTASGFDTMRHLHLHWFAANFEMSPPNSHNFLLTSLSAASISLKILLGVCTYFKTFTTLSSSKLSCLQ